MTVEQLIDQLMYGTTVLIIGEKGTLAEGKHTYPREGDPDKNIYYYSSSRVKNYVIDYYRKHCVIFI